MEFWSSAELNGIALSKILEIRALVEDTINAGITSSKLAEFDGRLNYVPIIMTTDSREHYPARSRAQLKKRVYSCCPQLDYDAFVSSTPAERVAIFLDGLRGCGPGLAKLGATPEQVAEFDRILDETLQVVTDRLNQSSQT